MQTLLWIGDVVVLLGVIPIAVFLLLRIITALIRAHRAIVNIGHGAAAITETLPPALNEVVGVVGTVASLRPKK